MGGLASRNKGKRGEREVIKLLQPIVDSVYGEGAILLQRNMLQSDKGGCDIAGLEKFAIEIKRHERLNVKAWWRQTLEQAKPHQIPVLFYRQNGESWTVMYSTGSDSVCTTDVPTFTRIFETVLKANPL